MRKELHPLYYLFNNGENYQSYLTMGAHKCNDGWEFSVWAPQALKVSLVGDFNGWNESSHQLELCGETGIWHIFTKDIGENCLYKYAVTDKLGNTVYKADPFAFKSEVRPNTASVTYEFGKYKWSDKSYMKKKEKYSPYNSPVLIYELNISSWKRKADGSFLTYRETADELINYVKEMGYTHIELMPLTEYPFDGSWGYQVTGYFCATSRFGNPEDLMYLIDKCHQNNIGVIMDWVPAHFPRDAHGLFRFDGTPQFEYSDPRIGEHKSWGTVVFDYSKKEVISFLTSSAYFWFDKYHIDGLRVDAVSSMIYLDYDRRNGEYLKNKYGGNENLEALEFFRTLNKIIFANFKNPLMIAEESTSYPMVTGPVHEGGLGFNYKWNMGWMNDTLRYMSIDPLFRKGNHNLLTFLMYYAFSENFILPLSHDEVVHGKKSLLNKMYGSYEEKFKSLKLLYAYMMAVPGKKMLFMGSEFGQFDEWNNEKELDWMLLNYNSHKELFNFVKDLNHTYVKEKAFWEIEKSWDGFKWIKGNDSENSVIAFMRSSIKKTGSVVAVFNFTPVCREDFRVGVASPGHYKVILGSERSDEGTFYKADKIPVDGFNYSIKIKLYGLSAIYLKKSRRSETQCQKNA